MMKIPIYSSIFPRSQSRQDPTLWSKPATPEVAVRRARSLQFRMAPSKTAPLIYSQLRISTNKLNLFGVQRYEEIYNDELLLSNKSSFSSSTITSIIKQHTQTNNHKRYCTEIYPCIFSFNHQPITSHKMSPLMIKPTVGPK